MLVTVFLVLTLLASFGLCDDDKSTKQSHEAWNSNEDHDARFADLPRDTQNEIFLNQLEKLVHTTLEQFDAISYNLTRIEAAQLQHQQETGATLYEHAQRFLELSQDLDQAHQREQTHRAEILQAQAEQAAKMKAEVLQVILIAQREHIRQSDATVRALTKQLVELRDEVKHIAAVHREQKLQAAAIQQEQAKQLAEMREETKQVAAILRDQVQTELVDTRKRQFELLEESAPVQKQLESFRIATPNSPFLGQEFKMIQQLVGKDAGEKEKLLFDAARSGNATLIRYLILAGADVDAKDRTSWNKTSLAVAAWKGHVDAINTLVGLQADVGTKDDGGDTPLHLASLNGQTDAIKALIASNAEVNSQNNNGNTPLHGAAWGGHAAAIKALIASDGEVNSPNNDGDTPLHYAARKGQKAAITALLQAGANKLAENNISETPKDRAQKNKQADDVLKLLSI